MTTGEPLGNLESGLAAALTGSARTAIVSGGLACLAVAVAVTAARPMLWHYDARTRPPGPASPGPVSSDPGDCQPSVTG
jgi:hypothetical protein